MSGIFGIITKSGSKYKYNSIRKTLERVALYSESRGANTSGIAIRKTISSEIDIIKGEIPIQEILKSELSNKNINHVSGFTAFGQVEMIPDENKLDGKNTQPLIKDGIVTVHDGTIVNSKQLWEQNSHLKQSYIINTEIIPTLLRYELKISTNLADACSRTLAQLEGTFSVAMMFNDLNQLVLATNNGSIYYITDSKTFIVFASEEYFLNKLKQNSVFAQFNKDLTVEQLYPNNGLIVNIESLETVLFDITDNSNNIPTLKTDSLFTINENILGSKKKKSASKNNPAILIDRNKESHLFSLLENNIEAIKKLKRCNKCLLPETFPYITYDAKGVCNYCNNYKPQSKVKTMDELHKLVEPYRRAKGEPDCIVPFSGGRDSTYSLHIIKKELGLNPIAFTYDWGMVTDLARNNIARVCGELGVENITVSADMKWKRENIRKNIEAWLKYPSLGMIPLFMAGDKFFFYHTNKVKKQTGIDLNIWGINDLENTEFKVGFAGLPPDFDKKRIYSLSIFNQLKLFGYVGKNMLKSPGYINQSLIDNLGSFASRYISPKNDYYHLFDYYRWDENEINNLLQNEYQWETAIDTKSTWRIGDGTASFYNYIYYTVAGFSENDTFRSNQIREGMLTREEAMRLIEEDNIPRYETLRWYFEIIGLDFTEVINVVNSIPKLYYI